MRPFFVVAVILFCIFESSNLSCPPISKNLVYYKEILLEDGQLRNGTCIPNAVVPSLKSTPSIICHKNGSYALFGECVCDRGYYRDDEVERKEQRCQACPNGKTKSDIGNKRCISPGRNTMDCHVLTSVCPCKETFFRILEEENTPGTNCYRIGKVRRLYYSNHTRGYVHVKWPSPIPFANYAPVYNVSLNDGEYEDRDEFWFKASEESKKYKIKIITSVRVGNKTYKGEEFIDYFTVHPIQHLNSGTILTSALALLLLSMLVNLLMLKE